MKVCKVTLRQGIGGLYRIDKVSNTTELQLGSYVPRDKVREWCAMKRVNVEIVGLVEEEEAAPELQGLTCQDVQRVDALQLAAETMKDTGPGENPF